MKVIFIQIFLVGFVICIEFGSFLLQNCIVFFGCKMDNINIPMDYLPKWPLYCSAEWVVSVPIP